MLTPEEIARRLDEVRERIALAANRARRPPESIRLVLASKTQPAGALAAAYDAGARDFGENYVQEAVEKRAALGFPSDVRWHMIGHLQTNKARDAARTFDLIHTIDSERLAAALFRLRAHPLMPALVEINLGGEASKSGVAPDRAEALIDAVRTRVEVRGLMTIPPPGANLEAARPWFAKLREMSLRLAASTGLELSELSMGMTEDYAIAIEEGATIVRVGRAVFGDRQT
jgi:pyridoxal phosphate enzyme (YggS family)